MSELQSICCYPNVVQTQYKPDVIKEDWNNGRTEYRNLFQRTEAEPQQGSGVNITLSLPCQ